MAVMKMSRKHTPLMLLAACCVALAAQAQQIHASKADIECEPGGEGCTLNIGGAVGKLSLPAVVKIQTPNLSYLSVTPPIGGEIGLADQPRDWEVWAMEEVGDKVAFRSVHGTYLSENWAPCDGFELTGERLDHELFELEPKWAGAVAIKCYNGLYISAYPTRTQWPEGIRQMPFPPKAHEWSEAAWEIWNVESVKEGHVALRSAHGTYLGASPPKDSGAIKQQYNAVGEWESLVLDHVDGNLTIGTSHGTFLAAQAERSGRDALFLSGTVGAWELWAPFVNGSTGAVCLQSHSGLFLHPHPNTGDKDWSLVPDCTKTELLALKK